MTFHSFEDMDVWQESRKMMREIRRICKKQQVARDFTWTDQITRSALSVQSNIAEGSGSQSNAVFAQFLGHSRRSSYEVRSQLYYGLDEGYMTQEEFKAMHEQAKKIAAQLSKLIRYLRQNKNKSRECFSNVAT